MAFTIKDNDESFSPNPQSIWMETDINALVAGLNGEGVVSGCAVTAQGTPDMTVAVAAGIVQLAGVVITVASGNVTITAADATNPRIDLIVVNNLGTKSATAGTPNAGPKAPDIPANSVLLAMVYVPANDTSIETPQITDKRVIIIGATQVRVRDQFLGGLATNGNVGELGWSQLGGTLTYPSAVSGHPGIVNMDTTAVSGTLSGLRLGNASTSNALASELFDTTFIVRLNTNDANTLVRFGISNGASSNPPTDGVYVEKLEADTQWFGVTRASSSQTRTAALATVDDGSP